MRIPQLRGSHARYRLGLRPDPYQCHKETALGTPSIDEPIKVRIAGRRVIEATSARLHDQIGDSTRRKSFGVCFRWSVTKSRSPPCPHRGFRSSPGQPDTYGWLQASFARSRAHSCTVPWQHRGSLTTVSQPGPIRLNSERTTEVLLPTPPPFWLANAMMAIIPLVCAK